jgi:hypothetical protein
MHLEVRHDRRFGQRHWFTAGLFSGVQEREIKTDFTEFLSVLVAKLRITGAYVRDEIALNDQWKIIGDLQYQHIGLEGRATTTPPLFEPFLTQRDADTLLPRLVISYQPKERTGIRLGLRRLAAAIADFQLLRPTDVFRELDELPGASLFSSRSASGRSAELELDHTFKNTSFLRVTLFDQDLNRAENGAIGTPVYPRVKQRGARVSYEGSLNANTSFFMRLSLNHARNPEPKRDAEVPDTKIAMVPRTAPDSACIPEPQGVFHRAGIAISGQAFGTTWQRRLLRQFSVLNFVSEKRSGLSSMYFVN